MPFAPQYSLYPLASCWTDPVRSPAHHWSSVGRCCSGWSSLSIKCAAARSPFLSIWELIPVRNWFFGLWSPLVEVSDYSCPFAPITACFRFLSVEIALRAHQVFSRIFRVDWATASCYPQQVQYLDFDLLEHLPAVVKRQIQLANRFWYLLVWSLFISVKLADHAWSINYQGLLIVWQSLSAILSFVCRESLFQICTSLTEFLKKKSFRWATQ